MGALTISGQSWRCAVRRFGDVSCAMSNVIPFPCRSRDEDLTPEIDLMTAVDVAIRDLRDIARRLGGDEAGRRQADECLTMLTRALEQAQAAY